MTQRSENRPDERDGNQSLLFLGSAHNSDDHQHHDNIGAASSDFGTARGYDPSHNPSEGNQGMLDQSMTNVNDHYGFYQNQEKVITSEALDQTEVNQSSFLTPDQPGEETDVIDT